MPTLSESLAGRAVFLDLWPLSMAERTGGPTDFFYRLFDASGGGLSGHESRWTRGDYIRVICEGGFPEVLPLTSAIVKRAWYDGTSPGSDTARHLRWFKAKVGDRFQTGIVFHLGSRASSFGERIQAIPVSALWGHATL